MKLLNILVSAYACRPDMGSEPGVGWNTVRELAKYHNIWVLTRAENRVAITTELLSNQIPNLHFVYCDLPGSQIWKQGLQGVHLHYYLWQIVAYFAGSKLHNEHCFDVVHHVTYVRYSTPSFLSFLPIPFIWGPVGGGEAAPKAFWKDFSIKGRVYEIVRRLAHQLGELDPFARLTAQRSFLVGATTEETAERLNQMGAINVQVFSESALSEAEIEQLGQCTAPNHKSSVRFISLARLLHWKGIHLGLQAFAAAKLADDAEYWIVGEGSEKRRLQDLSEALGIATQVKFWGRLSRNETLEKLSECDVLLHPSLHDSGGWVCLEAMAAGRPVVCLDLGGPAVQTTEETGFKISAQTPQQVICDLAQAISQLAEDPELRVQMGQAGRNRVQKNFSWKTKGEKLAQLYIEAADRNEETAPV